MLSGDNGILQKATDAKIKTEKAQIIENAQTDILGQQTENKGDNITKKELSQILNKYFKTTEPTSIPDEISSTNDIELITLDDKYNIHLSEIYTGKMKKETPGLYYAGTDELIMSWEELIKPENAMISFSDDGTIGRSAFNVADKFGSDKKVKLVVSDVVTKIGQMPYLSQLQEVVLPNTITNIGSFSSCPDLEKITIPSGIIGSSCFASCSKLNTVKLGNKVTEIQNNAFASCNLLSNIEIPDSVTNINNAFASCTGLTTITIPKTVTNIGTSVCSGCSKLEKVIVECGNITPGMFSGCRNIKSFELGEGTIEDRAFYNKPYENTWSVILGEGVTKIGNESFRHSGVASVVFPNSLQSIGDLAFAEDYYMESVSIPSGTIGNAAFTLSSGYALVFLKTISIGAGVTSIGNNAFGGNSNVETIELSEGLKTIGATAFSGCTKVEDLIVPNSVSTIGGDAFSGIKHITYNGTTTTGSPWGANSIN